MVAERWPIVIIESPFSGDTKGNLDYLFRACRDCLERREVPYASHGFFTQFLDDNIPEDRLFGITAGYSMWQATNKIVFYCDRGWSYGMQQALERANKLGYVVEQRYIENHQEAA